MGLAQTVRSFRNIWSHGEDEEEFDEVADSHDAGEGHDAGYSKYQSPSVASYSTGYSNGSNGSSSRKLRTVPLTMRAREKNIYTLRPKNQDEAVVAADYLKTGSAVVLNLEEVERLNAVRIIDFMSGVCYGLEGQGHAMKLGEKIFLFTPGEFEISSDETDYGENRDLFFKDIPLNGAGAPPADLIAAPAASTHAAAYASEKRSWER